MKKLLVTGAGGFVGQALCSTLKRRDIEFLPVYRKEQKPEINSFIISDINESTDWSLALKNIDVVIHLAARVHVMNEETDDPLSNFRALNVDATINLAKQAAQLGARRFVYVSSIKVNGEKTTDVPFTAFDMPAPIDPYGQSKYEAEFALKELSDATGLEVVVVRPPLVYGPGVRANFLRLMKLVKLGMPLPFGAIRNCRSMVALDNLIDLLIVCADHDNASGNTFLVSDGHDLSTTELLIMLANAMDKRSMLLPFPSGLLAGGAALIGKAAIANRLLDSLQVDIAHTTAVLNWVPIVGVEEAINSTVAHFLNHG
ncbi:UDP-glucose 4-epimerase family protein [Collimonas fungivorans]|uniref:UDP-glucose 4-epimerase family protein n=1 Tax=Collimonas fungivorans TaxID=158899 RepID=UPI0007782906|nr:SDR family oxidoreductase [Collimonas fungivorans]